MLYPKNSSKKLDPRLFENPTAEYRAAPFWAWNTKLKLPMLLRQIEYMKEMGFGGFHMHPRVGMATPYLSEEYMTLVRACVEKAKSEDMLAWLYDEDKWPSGFAGGLNTRKPENRMKFLTFTSHPYDDGSLTLASDVENAESFLPGDKYVLLGCYDIELDQDGCLLSSKMLTAGAPAKHSKWFAYMEYDVPSAWYNGQTYVDTMSKRAIEEFVALTHERYKNAVGDDFGDTIKAIFCDEPQMKTKEPLNDAFERGRVILPYTVDLPQTYREASGLDFFSVLPEIVFDLPGGEVSRARYCYHDHTAERFASAFADTIGKWCTENGIYLTGHMMREPSLDSQTCSLGDTMRSYRSFGLPGIDMLADHHELSTAKQCQSAVRQYGREGMTSEIYGVTTWDYDFKGHKQQGDWQAAFGVTVRVPHLTWVSMNGEAKRDYPASIGYQAPWFREYGYIEDHFARINTVMTRGRPIVNIGVVHPVESYWLKYGPKKQTELDRSELQKRFYEILNWLIFGSLDYDLICESLLPGQFGGTDGGFTVGEMKYGAVVVPSLITIRSTTLAALEQFAESGGKVIFMGGVPGYVDAVKSDRPRRLAEKCFDIDWSRRELFRLLEPERELSVKTPDGVYADNITYNMRLDGDVRHVFFAHVTEPKRDYDTVRREVYDIVFKGEWKLDKLDTLTGARSELAAEYDGGNTVLRWECYRCDSLLLELSAGRRCDGEMLLDNEYVSCEFLSPDAEFTLEEPNVLLLDCPEYSFGGGEKQGPEEILRVNGLARSHFRIRSPKGQPWFDPCDKNPTEKVTLFYEFESDVDYSGAELALESVEYASVTLNGAAADMTVTGYYIDEDAIKKIALPDIARGRNVLRVEYRYGGIVNLEAMYLLGEFGVELKGRKARITALPEKLGFSCVTGQGLPFYGGNITYHFTYTGGGEKTLRIQRFRGTAISVDVDGERVPGMLCFPPNTLPLGKLADGEHSIDVTLYGSRSNTLSPLHNTELKNSWPGPDMWRAKGRFFAYEYLLRENGILTTPQILE